MSHASLHVASLLLTLLFFFFPNAADAAGLSTSPFFFFDDSAAFSADVQLGDVDEDGDLDAVVANGRHWAQQDRVFLNQGGRFLRGRNLGKDLTPSYTVVLAELDGDGHLDAFVVLDGLPNQVFFGDGKGHFRPGPELGTEGWNARAGLAADLDGDGDLDLAVAHRREADLLFFNDGTGHFGPARALSDAAGATTSLAVGDFDGDGDLDLAMARRDGQPCAVALNDGTGTFEEREIEGSVGDTRKVVTADFDGDGRLDLAFGRIGATNQFFFGVGTGHFVAGTSFGLADGLTAALAVADLDLDGDPDLVEGNAEQPNAIVINQGGRRKFERFVLPDEEGESEDTYGVAIGDLNGDKFPDLVFANSGDFNQIYRSTADAGGSK